MAMKGSLVALGVLTWATVLLCVAEAQYGELLYDEGNVGDEFYSQPNYSWSDAAEDTRLQATAGSYGYPDGQTTSGDSYAGDDETQTGPSGDVSLAGFDMEEMGDSGGKPPKASPPGKSGGCQQTGNSIDDCWRCDPDWASHRQSLASCAAGFGRSAIGGKNGKIYVVTSNADDPANPAPGTLRYGVTRTEPLWIMFESSMTIKLTLELMINSYKTIDGRGVTVHIAGGGGLKINKVTNVIVHNIAIHDIKVTGPGKIMMTPTMVQKRNKCDGDAITVYGAKNVWIDHCYFANAADGLVDVTKASDGVTISNCYFTNHNKIMLFGASAKDTADKDMHVTVAYNKFGPNCVQRMPRVRFGYAHVLNNYYPVGWKQYAVAGSEGPTILSQGNVYNALNSGKQVTKRINDGGPAFGGPENWSWKSEGDEFQSQAYWAGVPMKWSADSYSKTVSCIARPASMVPAMTKDAGLLDCKAGSRCA